MFFNRGDFTSMKNVKLDDKGSPVIASLLACPYDNVEGVGHLLQFSI